MDAPPQRFPAMEPLDESLEEAEHMYRKRGCCCFFIPTLSSPNHNPTTTSSSSSSSSFWCRMRPSSSSSSPDSWWRRALKSVRDWSELVAGPRWKTFIRRFNRGGGHRGVGWRRRFQYDPLSYAMNFDEGGLRDDDDDGAASEYGFRAFSARYAAPPVSAKSSMDLGGRDAPPLFTAPASAGSDR